MHVIKIYSNNIRQKTSFGNDFNYSQKLREQNLEIFRARVANLPEFDTELSDVIQKSLSFRSLYKRVKTNTSQVRAFYLEQLDKLQSASARFSSMGFSRKLGNLGNSIINTEYAISARARGKVII